MHVYEEDLDTIVNKLLKNRSRIFCGGHDGVLYMIYGLCGLRTLLFAPTLERELVLDEKSMTLGDVLMKMMVKVTRDE